MECKNCVFWWFNEDIRRSTCNYSGMEEDAPCNQEEDNDNLEGGAYDDEEECYFRYEDGYSTMDDYYGGSLAEPF